MTDDYFTRRAFLGALAASVVAAGAPLPEGLSRQMGVDLACGRDTTCVFLGSAGRVYGLGHFEWARAS